MNLLYLNILARVIPKMADYSFTEDDLEFVPDPEEEGEEPLHEVSSLVSSSVDKDVEMEGVLHLKHGIDIAGKFEGQILSNHTVNIKEEGLIKGQIDAFNCVIEGRVECEMTARKRLEIRGGGTFVGNLEIQPEVIILSEFANFGEDEEVANNFKKEFIRDRTKPPEEKKNNSEGKKP